VKKFKLIKLTFAFLLIILCSFLLLKKNTNIHQNNLIKVQTNLNFPLNNNINSTESKLLQGRTNLLFSLDGFNHHVIRLNDNLFVDAETSFDTADRILERVNQWSLSKKKVLASSKIFNDFGIFEYYKDLNLLVVGSPKGNSTYLNPENLTVSNKISSKISYRNILATYPSYLYLQGESCLPCPGQWDSRIKCLDLVTQKEKWIYSPTIDNGDDISYYKYVFEKGYKALFFGVNNKNYEIDAYIVNINTGKEEKKILVNAKHPQTVIPLPSKGFILMSDARIKNDQNQYEEGLTVQQFDRFWDGTGTPTWKIYIPYKSLFRNYVDFENTGHLYDYYYENHTIFFLFNQTLFNTFPGRGTTSNLESVIVSLDLLTNQWKILHQFDGDTNQVNNTEQEQNIPLVDCCQNGIFYLLIKNQTNQKIIAYDYKNDKVIWGKEYPASLNLEFQLYNNELWITDATNYKIFCADLKTGKDQYVFSIPKSSIKETKMAPGGTSEVAPDVLLSAYLAPTGNGNAQLITFDGRIWDLVAPSLSLNSP
jgi:hypothetical protein